MTTPPFDARERLDDIIGDIERNGWSERWDFVADASGFFHDESEWRLKGRKAYLDWIASEGGEGVKAAVKAVGESTSWRESSDLLKLLQAARDTTKIRTVLEGVHEMAGKEYPPRDRVAHARALRDSLEKLVEQTNCELDCKPHEKWPVVSAMLMLASPEHFPVIRPSIVKDTYIKKRMFQGIEYKLGADPDLYGQYIERAQEFHVAMDERFKAEEDLKGPPNGLRSVSEWWIGLRNSRNASSFAHGHLIRLLEQGRHVVLQGPPGTGKTHAVESIAGQLIRQEDTARACEVVELARFEPSKPDGVGVVKHFVQFHASFDYEDFVRGFRPRLGQSGQVGFALEDGPFARMVSLALRFPAVKFLLVIDEINRADLARVLGECIYLLDRRAAHGEEGEARGYPKVEEVFAGTRPGSASLRYQPTHPAEHIQDYDGKECLLSRLVIPDNFCLMGTMNTADRSIAIVDVALRRRFAFVDVEPDTEVAIAHMRRAKNTSNAGAFKDEHISLVRRLMETLNGGEEGEEGLITDPRYRIGHAYFMKPDLDGLRASVRYQLLPLLREYEQDGLLRAGSELEELMDKLTRTFEAP
jgi:DNA polymerase III delta prime subunit